MATEEQLEEQGEGGVEHTPLTDGWHGRAHVVLTDDLDDQVGAGLEVAQVQELFHVAFTHAPIGMAIADPSGRLVIVNEAMVSLTGFSQDDLMRGTIRDVTAPEDHAVDEDDRRRLVAGEMFSYHAQLRLRRADETSVWVKLTVSRVGGVPPRMIIYQAQDISKQREFESRLEYLVDHDYLTGLYNRRRFERELTRQIGLQHRYHGGGALLLMDLDGFKGVNDALGHAAGDELLRGLAARLQERTRTTDVLARLSGDEFALLLPNVDRDQARTVASQVLAEIQSHVAVLGDQRASVTASIGVALFDGLSEEEVVTLADAAMYAAKGAGRDGIVVYSGHDEARQSRHGGEAERLRRALNDERFVLYCQPIRGLAAGEIAQYELLIRMLGETDGQIIPPNAFLYAAERFGLVAAIDTWVVTQAVTLIREQADRGRRVVLAVNLSARSIGDPTLERAINRCLDQSGIDPSCLVFELTETATVVNIDAAQAFSERLHRRGCRFALDDFGAGFAPFRYIKNLPFDFIKIDGDYVRGLSTNPIDRLVVTAIVSIAKGMGIETTAEFVADQDTSDALKAAGVDFEQGFHIARPRPVADVLAEIR